MLTTEIEWTSKTFLQIISTTFPGGCNPSWRLALQCKKCQNYPGLRAKAVIELG